MKLLFLTAFLFFGIFRLGENNIQKPVVQPENLFDFWLGSWDLTWKTADGNIGKGTNLIEKVMNEKVIQENFVATDAGQMTGYKGMSVSVYNSITGEWKQTWVDNQGSYLDFTGEFEGEKRIFKRDGQNPQGEKVWQRMVFYDIEENSFTWDWESSNDGGDTWELKWRINYQRAGELK